MSLRSTGLFRASLPCVALALVAEACADDAAATGDGGGGAGALPEGGHYEGGAVADASAVVGTFEIELPPASGDGAPSVVGKVYDGPTPSTLVWEPGTEQGDCRLFTPRVPYCPVACGGAAACVEDDTCKAYPSARSVGTVTVTGVQTASGDPLTLEPIATATSPSPTRSCCRPSQRGTRSSSPLAVATLARSR